MDEGTINPNQNKKTEHIHFHSSTDMYKMNELNKKKNWEAVAAKEFKLLCIQEGSDLKMNFMIVGATGMNVFIHFSKLLGKQTLLLSSLPSCPKE
jgi:hypothetical protein